MYLIYTSNNQGVDTLRAAKLIEAAGFTSEIIDDGRRCRLGKVLRFVWRPLDPAQLVEPIGDQSELTDDLIKRLAAERNRVESELAHLTEEPRKEW